MYQIDTFKSTLIIILFFSLLWLLLLKNNCQKNEILNVAVLSNPFSNSLDVGQSKGYVISIFEDGNMYIAIGEHNTNIWRNSLELGCVVNRSWDRLNKRGYWQWIWRGSIKLDEIVWESQIGLGTEDFERIKKLISIIDEERLHGEFILAHTYKFMVNTRQTRYFAQYTPGHEDANIIALIDELVIIIQNHSNLSYNIQ